MKNSSDTIGTEEMYRGLFITALEVTLSYDEVAVFASVFFFIKLSIGDMGRKRPTSASFPPPSLWPLPLLI
jgi:hypothetical protein